MRTLTANASTKLSQNMGTEWVVLLEVDWVGSQTMTYSDQEYSTAKPTVIGMGGFDGSMMLTGSADTQQLDIVLDDVDGVIHAIYEANDLHKRPARVYMVEKSLPITDKILVFKGELVTPIRWDEAQRTLSFNILSKLNSTQVGFSMEEGDFANIPDEALGKAWPLVFGQVCHLPAVKVRAPRRGYLETGVGIHDFTLEPRICQAVKIECPSQSTGNQSVLQQGANNSWTTETLKTIGPDLECVNRRYGEICKLKDLLEQQMAYEYKTVNIYNGTSFPQNQEIKLFVDNAVLTGSFSGNVFTITSRKHPEYDTFNHVACRDVPAFGYGQVAAVPQIGGSNNVNNTGGYWLVQHGQLPGSGLQSATWIPADNTGVSFQANQTQAQAFQSCEEALSSAPGMSGGPKDSWKYYDEMEKSSFFWAPPGSEVYMESESEILYMVSLLPGTVDMVCAFRQAPNGFRYLTEVPTDYYTSYLTDYGGYQVVEIGMNRALSLYNDQWEDDIYVSFTSTVGPNPCDIIEWLIGKYTDLSIDPTTFADVKTKLSDYGTNFYVIDRPDVYDLINDIAYQSRCAVYVRNDVMYIKYLPEEPTSVRTISEDDILNGTFIESLSETEEVYTTHNINWQKGGAAVRDDKEVEQKLVLKYNVDKYGTVEQDWDYYCHNIFDQVNHVATFWLIRKANCWRKVEFSLPLKHLDLDVGDCITLNVAQFGDPVKAIIEQSTVNPDENTVSLVCWTPIRSGESSEYYWAWPAAKPCHGVWPLPLDTHGGGGYNFSVTPPVGHLLTGGQHRDDQLIISSGKLHPSDLCDINGEVICEVSDYLNFDETDPIIEAKAIAQSASRQAMENGMTGGGNADGGGGTKKRSIDGCGTGVGCNYKVIVQWHTSHAQGQATALGGAKPGGPCGGPCKCWGGCPSCYGPIWSVCHTHGGASFAAHAAQYWKSHYGRRDDGWWNCRETRVLNAVARNGTHDPHTTNNGELCPDVTDPEEVAADAEQNGTGKDGTSAIGETKEPTGTTGDEPSYGDATQNPFYGTDAESGTPA